MDRRRFIHTTSALALSATLGTAVCSAVNRQRGWRRCNKCQGLVWDQGHCPAGQQHSFDDPNIYFLVANDPAPKGQENWRVCRKCMALWYAGGVAKGRCPKGDAHSDSESWNYVLETNGKGQNNWNQCRKCQGLFYGEGASAGVCPKSGKHEKLPGSDYTLELQRFKKSVTGKAVAGFEALDAIMEKHLKRIGCTAASLTITRSHHAGPNGMQPTADVNPLYSRGYGWCDLEQTVPMQPDTVIDIGSCTKCFSAAAIRQLALDGKLDLDASVLKLLKIEPKGKVVDNRVWDITINHLIEMKTGWLDDPYAKAVEAMRAARVPATSYYEWPLLALGYIMVQNLRDAPGQKWEYDNLAYGAIEAIVHRFCDVGHPEYLRTRLYRPYAIGELCAEEPTGPPGIGKRVWNAFGEGTTSPPWAWGFPLGGPVADGVRGHANLYYSTPVMCHFMRYFWKEGQPRTNERLWMTKTGLFDSTTSVMLWHESGLDVAASFNGRREIEEWHWVNELKEAVDQLVSKNRLPSPPKPPANLVHNGSFEEGPRFGDIMPLDQGSTLIKGWKVTHGQIDLYGSGLKAQDGGRCLDLHGSPGYGGIEQTFKTKIGQRYRVTFAMAGSPGGSVPVKRLAVRAAGSKEEFAFDCRDRKPDNMGWVEYAWEFEAVEEQSTLEFHTIMTSDPYFGPVIDNVRVRPVAAKK